MSESETTAEARRTDIPYQMMGGAEVVRRVVDRFYDIMDTDPGAARIRAMHAKDLTPMRERLYEFLSGWLGGPALYFQRPEHKCIRSAHSPFAIGEVERDEWMMCMRRALKDCNVPEEVRDMIDAPLMRMCEAFRNR